MVLTRSSAGDSSNHPSPVTRSNITIESLRSFSRRARSDSKTPSQAPKRALETASPPTNARTPKRMKSQKLPPTKAVARVHKKKDSYSDSLRRYEFEQASAGTSSRFISHGTRSRVPQSSSSSRPAAASNAIITTRRQNRPYEAKFSDIMRRTPSGPIAPPEIGVRNCSSDYTPMGFIKPPRVLQSDEDVLGYGNAIVERSKDIQIKLQAIAQRKYEEEGHHRDRELREEDCSDAGSDAVPPFELPKGVDLSVLIRYDTPTPEERLQSSDYYDKLLEYGETKTTLRGSFFESFSHESAAGRGYEGDDQVVVKKEDSEYLVVKKEDSEYVVVKKEE